MIGTTSSNADECETSDVVLVQYPFASGAGSSLRPALIVQNDRDNEPLRNTIVAQITTNLRRASDPSHLLISPGTPRRRGIELAA
jgi:mRNA interferase MazF